MRAWIIRGLTFLVLLGLFLYTYLGNPPSSVGKLHKFAGETMGTTYTVKVAENNLDATRVKQLAGVIQSALDEVDQKMSTYKPDSEISRFNRHLSTKPFFVSSDTLEVVGIALKVSELSSGAFDMTVGPLVEAWGFGARHQETFPTDLQIESLMAGVGFEKILVDTKASTLTKSLPKVSCDLSAVAKGYGVDQVALVLDRLGMDNYMIEVGGEVRTRGQKAPNSPWTIAIERPETQGRTIQAIVALKGFSMATSGNYRNFRLRDGKRISHTLNPRTGRPITHNLASVTVIHQSCAWADALATALNVLGPDRGYTLALDLKLAALFIVGGVEGDFVEKSTPWFGPWTHGEQ